MNTKDYVSAYTFKNVNAAYRLATENKKHLEFAQRLIIAKMSQENPSGSRYQRYKQLNDNLILIHGVHDSNVRENGVISVNTETDLKLNHDVVKFQVEMLPNALKELLEVNDVSNLSLGNKHPVRRIVTLLTGITYSELQSVSDKAKEFLEENINEKTFKSFGDEMSISANDFNLLKKHTNRINEWIATIK